MQVNILLPSGLEATLDAKELGQALSTLANSYKGEILNAMLGEDSVEEQEYIRHFLNSNTIKVLNRISTYEGG